MHSSCPTSHGRWRMLGCIPRMHWAVCQESSAGWVHKGVRLNALEGGGICPGACAGFMTDLKCTALSRCSFQRRASVTQMQLCV